MNKMKRIVRPIPSLLLGLSFLLSGVLKGIDPYGTSLKLSEYFRVWGWGTDLFYWRCERRRA